MTLASLFDLGAAQSWNAPLVLLLIKATLILVAALGITLAMQRASAGARHLVWLVTLVALVMMPALTAWAPLRLEILPAAAAAPIAAAPLVFEAPSSEGSEARIVLPPPTSAPAPAVAASSATSSAASSAASSGVIAKLRSASIWTIALGAWAIIAAAILLSLTWSSLVVRRLVRRSHPLDDQSWMTPLWEVSDRMGLQEPPRLLLSHDAKMPFACGLTTPTIVLPSECESWSQERRLAVLLHELAHVRRRDLAGHTLGRLVCAVYWFHPLVWTAARKLRDESERACDDLALSCGTRATDYAEHLLDIVTSVRRETTPMVALAMARRKEFEGRMLAILDPELRHSTPSRRQSAALIAALALISVVVGAATPAPASARQTATQQHAAPDTASAAIVITSPAVSDSVHASLDVANDAPRHVHMQQRTHERVEQHTTTELSTVVSSATSSAVDASAARASKALGGLVSTVVEAVVPGAVSAGLDAGARALHVTAQDLMKSAPKGSKAADDRPVLLAKVLRSDSSAALRRVAAWGLAEYADQTVASDALVAALRRDASENVREMAAWSLGEGSRNTGVVEALSAALKDANVKVRRTAAWSLGQMGEKGSVDALVGALADADADVRARAVWALGEVGPKQAPKQLVAMLSDKDEHVRELTAWALYEIEDPTTAPALQAALTAEKNQEMQLKYIRALATMGESSVDAIRPLLESSDQRVREMAVHALAGGHATGPWPHPWPQPRPYP
ncbi:MAG: HEAT repeat domain-containing protein [Gemmatimonadetes bacterium]|nr:HEAT repeat domain-containing protein [Gemmatimonadota bacterium]